jgi:hypothetical protein
VAEGCGYVVHMQTEQHKGHQFSFGHPNPHDTCARGSRENVRKVRQTGHNVTVFMTKIGTSEQLASRAGSSPIRWPTLQPHPGKPRQLSRLSPTFLLTFTTTQATCSAVVCPGENTTSVSSPRYFPENPSM